MGKIYVFFGGRKWIFVFGALIVSSVALFCKVDPILFGEYTAGAVALGKFYFDAQVKDKDNEAKNAILKGQSASRA